LVDEKLTTALLTHQAHILTARDDSDRASKRKADTDKRSSQVTKKA